MPVSSFIFNVAKFKFANGTMDWDTDAIAIALLDSTCPSGNLTADKTTVAAVISTNTYEVNGSGYLRGYANLDSGSGGRKTLVCTVTQDDSGNRATLRANDVQWNDGPGISAGTVQGALVYKHVASATDASCFPIGWISSGGFPIITNGGALTIKWAENTGSEGIVITFA